MKKNQAFTITELIIVVIIIGVIAAFAVPNYQKSIRKAHQRDAVVQLTAIHSANLIYKAQQGSYLPTGGGDLNAINTGLNLNIVANNMIYTYQNPGPGGLAYSAFAEWTEGGDDFTIGVAEFPISNVNPCCYCGNCPSLNNCGTQCS